MKTRVRHPSAWLGGLTLLLAACGGVARTAGPGSAGASSATAGDSSSAAGANSSTAGAPGTGGAIAMGGSQADTDWAACRYDSDCALTALGCCDACDSVSGNSVVSVNSQKLPLFRQSQSCTGNEQCSPCPPVMEGQRELKYFRPVCGAEHCAVLDVRESKFAECSRDADCYIRAGVSCCPRCDNEGYVALNKAATLCDDPSLGCDTCASMPPIDMNAFCDQGHCALKRTP